MSSHVRFARLREQVCQATPLFVHVLMVIGVAAYAIFGALIIQKIESDPGKTVSKRHLPVLPPDLIKQVSSNSSEKRHHNNLDNANSELVRARRNSATVLRSRRCVISALKELTARGGCTSESLERASLRGLDKCYHVSISIDRGTNELLIKNSNEEIESVSEIDDELMLPWSFMDSLLFSFTVITTIGYGNVAPRTFAGRLFCIIYGLFGIPFTLLVIADLGKFLSEVMAKSSKKSMKMIRLTYSTIFCQKRPIGVTGEECVLADCSDVKLGNGVGNKALKDEIDVEIGETEEKSLNENDQDEPEEASASSEMSEPTDGSHAAVSLLILFFIYIVGGALMLSSYEPDMDFFKAIYFNFVTLTSIGLGDIVPKSETFMACTIIYIAVGLALTTIAIEIAADTLKKLHYFGRKIENVASVSIWFGGKKLTMRQLVKNLGDQFNLPVHTIKNLDLDHFVDQAIKVEQGEIETLRPPPIEPEDLRIESMMVDYADDENDNVPLPPQPPRLTPLLDPIPTPEPELPPPPVPDSEPEPDPPTPEPENEEEEELIVIEPVPVPIEPKKLTPAEFAAQKRKAYSEEAWKRYQEYQRQWRRFRHTKTPKRKMSRSEGGDIVTESPTTPKENTDIDNEYNVLGATCSSDRRPSNDPPDSS